MKHKLEYLGDNIAILSEGENSIKIDYKLEEGKCNMTVFDIFPGIQLLIYDFDTESCFREVERKKIIGINHCSSGRFECEFSKQNIIYMGEGDIAIASMNRLPRASSFPLRIFYGSSIIIMPEIIGKSSVFKEFGIKIEQLYAKYQLDEKCHIFRKNDQIDHIYHEIYNRISEENIYYLRLKVLELLHYLQDKDLIFVENNTYLPKVIIDKVKDVREHMIKNLDESIEIKKIVSEHGISLTQFKQCFKEIYGDSPYSYLKTYKMNVAAKVLVATDKKVGDIAMDLAYKNASKFSRAFEDVMGMTPRKYRSYHK